VLARGRLEGSSPGLRAEGPDRNARLASAATVAEEAAGACSGRCEYIGRGGGRLSCLTAIAGPEPFLVCGFRVTSAAIRERGISDGSDDPGLYTSMAGASGNEKDTTDGVGIVFTAVAEECPPSDWPMVDAA
jgi:hypothetical protein